MRFFYLFFTLLFPLALGAQKASAAKSNDPVVEYKRVPFATFHDNGKVKTKGYRWVRLENGNKIRESKRDRYGQMQTEFFDSTYQEFFEDGNVKKSIEYKKGKLDGLWQEWYDNAQMSMRRNYKNDLENGIWSEWYVTGGLRYQVLMTNGQENGIEQRWYENGQLRSVISYKEGQRQGHAITFFEGGTRKLEAYYENDADAGTHTEHYENGQKKAIWSFVEQEGVMESFWDEGGAIQIKNGFGIRKGVDPIKNRKFEETYAEGRRNGPAKYYYMNGVLKEEGSFENDYEEGEWKFYDEQGKFIERVSYEHGMRTLVPVGESDKRASSLKPRGIGEDD